MYDIIPIQTLGRLGRVGVSVEDGFAVVVVDGKRWLLDPRCLVPARGEQPEDELSETFCEYLYIIL